MNCVICKNEIDKLKDSTGKVVWEHGNESWPIKDGKCCSKCKYGIVLPYRVIMSKISEFENNTEEKENFNHWVETKQLFEKLLVEEVDIDMGVTRN